MKAARIEAPSGQNWSCHACSDCCRNHLFVPLSNAEKERIEKQGWSLAEGVDPDKMIVAGINQYRLGHQPDGACVFLDASNRCRIHAKFGEAAKPLACRLYPFVMYPVGKKVLVGLRFSCPSAAANLGKPLGEYAREISLLAPEVLPVDADELPAPPVVGTPGLYWPDFLRFVRALEFTLAPHDAPLALKLLRSLFWLEKIERGYLDQISGNGADEIIGAMVRSAIDKNPALPASPEPPSRFGRLFLRLIILEHARTTTVADRNVRSVHRWKMLAAATRFIVASGRTPAIRGELKHVPFADIERFSGPLPAAAEAVLDRYFLVKIQSLQFCGKGFHNCSLVEGFRNLALMYPIIVWLSRWLALGRSRSTLVEADVLKAVSIVDYQYGFAPYVNWRTRLLHRRNDIARLIAWYAK